VQSSLSITGEVNTTADTLLDAKDKIFVRVITAQAPYKIAGYFRLSNNSMLVTPLAFDCSANEMSSALLELPRFAANITVARRGLSLENAYFWYCVHGEYFIPIGVLRSLKGVEAAVYLNETNPHSLNYGLRMSPP
jgi:hypothetical protein